MACIRKRRGKWIADYRDPRGRRRWITRDTRKEAEAALASVSVAIASDEYVAPDAARIFQTVYDHWWRVSVTGSDNKRGKPLSRGSQGFYAGLWSRYFVAPEEHQHTTAEARFAPRRLRSITQAEVAEWKEALSLRVGPRTVLAAFQMLSTLFSTPAVSAGRSAIRANLYTRPPMGLTCVRSLPRKSRPFSTTRSRAPSY